MLSVNLFFFSQAQEYSFEQVFNLQYLNFKPYEIPDKGDFFFYMLYGKKLLANAMVYVHLQVIKAM